MRKMFFPFALLLLSGMAFTSCSQDEEIVAESPVMRDYQTDAQILSKFVDINRSTDEYYINENKRTSVMSYLTDNDWLELKKVSPANYQRFEKGLQELNDQLQAYAKDPEISKIVYSTYGGETYVKELNHDCPTEIEKAKYDMPLSRATYQSISLSSSVKSGFASFTAGSTIHTNIQIISFGYYLVELKCNTSGAECTNNHSSGLVLSGTSSTGYVAYTWTSGSASTFWDFTATGRTLSSGASCRLILRIDSGGYK
ncbi:hypothetical protein QUW56_10285 [Phocaeicola barnesiae]|uniref:hypothetical protein n=1 Tax=Phocaeicola barnesiae TaxID=376804 RepID=UPI0025A3D349|nr:hypothetical protein [Phocaeicola barnesiae]MDM8233757.1 hypothetical protein [Phocaeicola barnesiae]